MKMSHNSVALHHTFFGAFPPPEIMRMSAVGLDVSDHSVRFVRISDSLKGHYLSGYAHRTIPSGAMASGNIKNVEAIKAVLTELKATHDFSFIHASIPEEKAYLYRTFVPRPKSREAFTDAVSFTLEENVPLTPAEAVFDYQVINDRRKDGEIEVGVTVLPQSVVHMYMELFHSVGIVPLSFEIEAQSIARAVVPRGDSDTVMVVDIGSSRTGISVVRAGVVAFTATLDLGGGALDDAIMKYFNVSKEEAVKIKHERGLVKNKNNKELFDSIVATMSALKDEIRKRIMYWDTHTEGHDKSRRVSSISEVIITGRDATLPGFADYFSSTLKIPVRLASAWVNMQDREGYVPPMSFRESLGFTTAIGLAIKDHLK